MNSDRIQIINNDSSDKETYVVYWMQQSQRAYYNHALEYAIWLANQKDLPLLVFFNLTTYPEANLRHYQFMLEGLKEVKINLENRHIQFVIHVGDMVENVLDIAKKAAVLVFDKSYMKHPRIWRRDLVNELLDIRPDIGIYLIDSDVIVPVVKASQKAEYAAYTIRPKLMRQYPYFLDFDQHYILKNTQKIDVVSLHLYDDLSITLDQLKVDKSVNPSRFYQGGHTQAHQKLNFFIENVLTHYRDNDPSKDLTSKMSMYLHFGQISSLEIWMYIKYSAKQQHISTEGLDAYLEQLLIRRELAINYVYYHRGYDTFENMTEKWAYDTMSEHLHDTRTIVYHLEQIEHAQTHDPYFNAAMNEMTITGYMHNYMRMYWAKKIIEWTPDYQTAYQHIIYLNNKYFIDGRDANSYAGVAWCFGKHDRAWTQRPIFGKLRYMNASGLERKFNISGYIKKIDSLKD